MLAKVYGSAVYGIEARIVTLEVNIDRGVGYHLVGLPDSAIRESNYRIAAALLNNGFRIPGKKITINMAPADLRKEGAAYDLSLALGILQASGQIQAQGLSNYVIMGELSLDGGLQPVKGALPIVLCAREAGLTGCILPRQNAQEACIVGGIEVYGVDSLSQVLAFFSGALDLEPVRIREDHTSGLSGAPIPDFNEVRGQEGVKRCMEIAAAGGHNLLMIGPPGAGKTMLAKRLPGILPPMTREEALETMKIHSVSGLHKKPGLMRDRPFRCPHHTISNVALVGGGSYPQPGEISLAHNGVLFLDELPEFKRHVLEVMRQPLEEGAITLSRARFTLTYPSSFMLVASMNPSPGGYFSEPEAPVGNTTREMHRYLGKISGPLLDRIDLHIEVMPVPFKELSDQRKGDSSIQIRQRVIAARHRQAERFKGSKSLHCNAQMSSKQVRESCDLGVESLGLLQRAMEELRLSARAYDRILKLSRTIADLEGVAAIGPHHLAEAIQYRSLDRTSWL